MRKSKKKAEPAVPVELEDSPEVVKWSTIKPTKCERCLCVYQAKHSHLHLNPDLGYIDRRTMASTVCPACRWINSVEFEEAEE